MENKMRFHFKCIFIYLLVHHAIALKPPEIFPSGDANQEITVKPGSQLTLKCDGDAPITWNFSRSETEFNHMDTKDNSNSTRLYSSTILLTNISVNDVGYIDCLYKDEDDVETVSIYLLVDDEENLLVPAKGHDLGLIYLSAFKGMPFTLPCKPSSHFVQIKLLKNSKEIDPNELLLEYDIKKGYMIDHVVATHSDHYNCIGVRKNVEKEFSIVLQAVTGKGYFSKPTINTHLANSISVGDNFSLDCSYESEQTVFFYLNWTSPYQTINSERSSIVCLPYMSSRKKKGYRCKLTIENAMKEDSGIYNCRVWNSNSARDNNITINIYSADDKFLSIEPVSANITVNKREDAVWILRYEAYPKPEFQWNRVENREELFKSPNDRYETRVEKDEIILKIKNVDLKDAGTYTFRSYNSFNETTENLILTVQATPLAEIVVSRHSKRHFNIGKEYEFSCLSRGYPPPDITWYFVACKNEGDEECRGQDDPLKESAKLYEYAQESVSKVNFNIFSSGYLKCFSENILGIYEEETFIKVLDFEDENEEGFAINGPQSPVVEGDDVSLLCAIDIQNKTKSLKWFYEDPNNNDLLPLEESQNMKISTYSSQWSYQSKLNFTMIQMNQSGKYLCKIGDSDSDLFQVFDLSIKKYISPVITQTNLNDSTLILNESGSDVHLYCFVEGTPIPNVTWYKNDTQHQSTWRGLGKKFHFSAENRNLTFSVFKKEDNGKYTCRAENGRSGQSVEHYQIIETPPEPKLGVGIWITIGVFFLLLLVTSGFLGQKLYKDHKMKMKVRSLIENEFHQGQKGQINPEIGVNEQVSMLPYDHSFEFPRENLKLGMQLGVGAFGRVMKGEARGIIENEVTTNVAVKMVKLSADETHLKALMSELKIMVHLGSHVNVVNLLGACTKNLIKKKELLVIVEYCKYGNLLNYLHDHRSKFVDQIDSNGQIDPNIILPGQKKRPIYQPQLNYAALTFRYSDKNSRAKSNGYQSFYDIQKEAIERMSELPDPPVYKSGRNPNLDNNYVSGSNIQSLSTDMSYINSVNGTTDGNNVEEDDEGYYKGDYVVRDVKTFTTTDLMCWTFQIARGMEYLTSRKVMHGDLAARNVLLAENGVVKICDFGLARKLYEYKYKLKKQDGLLPVKWMAPETIYYGDYSIQSDIWSFGIVMWELFSLGKTPYPGMEADERFVSGLNKGYRMNKPGHSPSSAYDLMLDCWNHEPAARPSFTIIADRIGNLMEEGLKKHYVDLNDRYNQMNAVMLETRGEDYLSMMAMPSIKGSPGRDGPRYQNLPQEVKSQISEYFPDYIPPTRMANNQEYQNLNVNEPKVEMLANNSGYMYMAHGNGSPPELKTVQIEMHQEDEDSEEDEKKINRKDQNSDDHQVNGITNINYMANTFSIVHSIEDADTAQITQQQKHSGILRQKNDSGVSFSSSESAFGDSDSKSPSPVECHLSKVGSTIYEISEDEKSNPLIFQNNSQMNSIDNNAD